MIFLIEQLIKNVKAKERAWERKGKKWVEERNSYNKYIRYSLKDYAKENPSPSQKIRQVFSTLVSLLIGLAIACLITWGIVSASSVKPDPNNPNNCSLLVKKDDKVAVTYGPFVGSEGTVIEQDKKGCGVKIRLTKSTNTRNECVEKKYKDCRAEKNVGEELYIDTSRNITKI